MFANILKSWVGFKQRIAVVNTLVSEHTKHIYTNVHQVIQKYKDMVCSITSYEEMAFKAWVDSVESLTTDNLEEPLLLRLEDGTLRVNFGNYLMSTLIEVKHLKKDFAHRPLPENVKKIFLRYDKFRNSKNILDSTVTKYNFVKTRTVKEEARLLDDDVDSLDERLKPAEMTLNWQCEDVMDYLEDVQARTSNLEEKLRKAQANVKRIKKDMSRWSEDVLFLRKDDPKEEPLLDLESREARKEKRYQELEVASSLVQSLVKENEVLLGGDGPEQTKNWNIYLRYLDDMVSSCLLEAVAVSLGYLLDQTDKSKEPEPLFLAELELLEPDIIFRPSLNKAIFNNFFTVFNGLIDDIFRMAELMPRVHIKKGMSPNYLETIETHTELKNLRGELVQRVEQVMDKANAKKDSYLEYSYLWVDSRADHMYYFLQYSRQLTQKELDKLEDNENAVKKEKPTLDQFRAQIDHYEGVHEKVRALENTLSLQGWFRADVTPFKHALMNEIKRWSYAFKKHLLDHVITSLEELKNFIDMADEALMMQVREGDYEGLIKMMEFLALVWARQRATDHMFQPLQDVIDLLRDYGMVIPNESLAQLEELPEKWANTKRLGIIAKTQVAPLMGMEVGKLRARIEEYQKFEKVFRSKYQQSRFFNYESKFPYEGLRKKQEKIGEFEEKLNALQSEAKLFEVAVPTFPLSVQCKKENKFLKDLWDLIYLIRSAIELWKTTSWANIDVESMDMECKKYGKEIRGLDKDMKTWHAFLGAESAVKNMLTSLRAIGELQNPAIRDRHWEQLVQVVKVRFVMSDTTTFADLLALNLHNFEDEVHNIVDKACKELAMEKMIKDLEVSWKTLEFDHDTHRRTGSTLLKTSEELIETLEENQVQLQNMMTSKFIGYFKEEIGGWQKCLCVVDTVITLWMDVQRTW